MRLRRIERAGETGRHTSLGGAGTVKKRATRAKALANKDQTGARG
jgi:hypothetical protein